MRLFVGIALDAATRSACTDVQRSLQRAGFAAKLEDPDKLHVTLAFLGNVEESRYATIAAAMEAVATASAPLAVTFDKVSAFPNERKPRIVYVGSRDQGAAFRALAHGLRDAYTAMGFEFRDDPVAHVTIARVKDPHRPLPLVDIVPVRLDAGELTLFESVFDKEKNTSRYGCSATSKLTAPSG